MQFPAVLILCITFQSDISVLSVKGSTDIGTEVADFSVMSGGESLEDDFDDTTEPAPLFLHLTCSVRDRSQLGSTINPVPIQNLPTCLGKSFSSYLLVKAKFSLKIN